MKIAFLFAGQGAQQVGMARDIASGYPEASAVFDEAEAALGRDLRELCFEGPKDELDMTVNTQPCVLAADLCSLAAVRSLGIKADAAAGFSLGEYAAVACTGAISVGDAFRMIKVRAEAMQEASPKGKGAMAAVMSKDLDGVRRLCERLTAGCAAISNYNCPGQTVVAGEAPAIEELINLSLDRGIRTTLLPISIPSHCELMRPAVEKLRACFSGIRVSEPEIPCYMNADACPATDSGVLREKLELQLTSPVMWEQTIRAMIADGFDTFIEMGPGKTLTGFVRKISKDVRTFSTGGCLSIDKMRLEL